MINPLKTSLAGIALALGLCYSAAGEDGGNTIKISAKKYDFTPHEIALKRGKAVTLLLTTEDRSHGFNIPSMHLRTDIQPGQVSELKLTPGKTGEYEFFCDVFCGSGHENMGGKIVVTD